MIDEYRVKSFCCEDICNIENYEKAIADTTQTWHCHHRRECVDGVFTSRKDLIANSLYYNRPASELIFLTKSNHSKLHSIGKHHTEEEKNKIREALSKPDVKKKMSDAVRLALSDPDVKKKMSDAAKGRPSNRKGKKTSDETKRKISTSIKRICQNSEYIQKQRNAKLGKRWYTDGVHCKLAFECPGEGWHFGKIHHKRS